MGIVCWNLDLGEDLFKLVDCSSELSRFEWHGLELDAPALLSEELT